MIGLRICNCLNQNEFGEVCAKQAYCQNPQPSELSLLQGEHIDLPAGHIVRVADTLLLGCPELYHL